jgi:hypothetical protein
VLFQFMQNFQHSLAAFAARKACKPACSGRDHAIGLDRVAYFAYKTFAQLFKFGRARCTIEERVDVFGVIKHRVSQWLERLFDSNGFGLPCLYRLCPVREGCGYDHNLCRVRDHNLAHPKDCSAKCAMLSDNHL